MLFVPNPCDSLIIGYLIPIAAGPIIPLMVLAYPCLGRYFDARVQTKESPDFHIGPIGTFIARPVAYALYVVLDLDWEKLEARAMRKNPNNPIAPLVRSYGSINYRQEANAFQVGLSWLYVLCLSLTVMLAASYAVCMHLL